MLVFPSTVHVVVFNIIHTIHFFPIPSHPLPILMSIENDGIPHRSAFVHFNTGITELEYFGRGKCSISPQINLNTITFHNQVRHSLFQSYSIHTHTQVDSW